MMCDIEGASWLSFFVCFCSGRGVMVKEASEADVKYVSDSIHVPDPKRNKK
jgi:hypothetical protein